MNPQQNNDSEARMKRAMEIVGMKRIVENNDGSFAVPSQTSNFAYEVRLIEQVWVCSCPDFENREIESCKHIYAVRFWIATNTYLQNKPKPAIFADDTIQCDRCGSIRVIRYGKSGNKQTFYCKDCGRKFTEPTLLRKAKYNPELISLTLDLYFSGLSLRKIARNINDHFDMELNFSTIYKWIQKYIPAISEYVNSLTPQLSDSWHADELFVKVKGGTTYKGNKGLGFLWNIMDRKTRFLIASKLSEARDKKGAIQAFKEAIRNANGLEPERIYTDSLKVYKEGIIESFDHLPAFKQPNQIAKCGIGKPHANNNRVERLNGTLRERVKVQRGWKSIKTPIAEGMRIQYNFVKPHMALNGQTPAEASSITTQERNKWLGLLTNALEKDKSY
jgi:transposase-like protein